jgi:spermidine/putrescine transport system ATP-binding protein
MMGVGERPTDVSSTVVAAAGGGSTPPAPESEPPGPAPSQVEAAISLRGVSKQYGTQVALQPTDLDIRDGEFFCLLGPSGCGKTTTLNLIGGFVESTSGEIFIRGERVDRVPPHKRSVNTVFQSYALFPHMTVEENVGFGLKMARLPKQQAGTRVARALEQVGLEDFGARFPGHLSGGQQQRVAVARALVNEPAVLLLDEPLGALDLKLRKRLQVELSEIQRAVGTTFIYVTHDQDEAMTMADRVAVMNGGRIEQIGTPHEVYERPASRFVADFIGESNFIPVRVEDGPAGAVCLLDGRRLPPAAVPEGVDAGVLMVRPEAVCLDTVRTDGDHLPGQVEAVTFLGSYTRVLVRCEGVEAPLAVAVRAGDHEGRPGDWAGSTVFISWSRKRAVVLKEDPHKETPQ